MNRPWILLLAGALAVAAVAGHADDAATAKQKPAKRAAPDKIDADGDGRVSFDEVKAVFPNITEAKFKARDKNGDGYLSPDERVISDPKPKPGAAPAPARMPGGEPGQLFKKADRDQDGRVTWEEVHALAPRFPEERFRQLDANSDGAITTDELPSARDRGAIPTKPGDIGKDTSVAQFARKADTDRNGLITYEEMQAVYPKFPRERFDELDKNSDGVLSMADRAQADRDSRQGIDENLAKLLESDSNKDGKLTFGELTTAKAGFPREAFDQADRNKDGVITADDAKRK
ncbi:MAG: EF-hand domain-containing protein [Candidatus Hydrogenedentes bacterium]|nr:EF-hand domain-containing protein [Candidatus Hydrogenedentota bacterium]